jgi:hypothetical protein
MILVDYSQTVISSFFAENVTETTDIKLLRHIVLNTIRSYNRSYSNQYGQLVLCVDGPNSWRKKSFPYYKAGRKQKREDSKIDWNYLFEVLNTVLEEIQTVNLYPTIKINHAEADDIISVLSEYSEQNNEKTLIISSDKDFVQLQQYSPYHKQKIKKDDPKSFLIEHIIRGDSDDDIPNVLSDDDTFVVDGKRQSRITQKRLDSVIEYIYQDDKKMPIDLKRNYDRNKLLIDLTQIPQELKQQIRDVFENEKTKTPQKKEFLDYLIRNRLGQLVGSIEDFF